MYYAIVCAAVCGFFAAFVGGRKGRNRVAWWFIGALLPVLGVVLSLLVPEKRAAAVAVQPGATGGAGRPGRRKPKRCCGSYIPDCFGCLHFRRPLFEPVHAEDKKGYCELFRKDLMAGSDRKGAKVVIEDR